MRIKLARGIQTDSRRRNEHNNKKKTKMASARKPESFVWTDNEVELLLRLTLDYKASKSQVNVDWESCKSKYIDLTNAFRAQYPREPTDDFPHEATALSKTQVTTKLKNIRGKYRRAVDTGRRSGQGRVVMLFYELCQEIWGGSPAARPIDSSIETDDLVESSQPSTPTEEMPASPNSTESHDRLPPAVVKQRRELLQAKLDSHRGDRLKRKARADPVEEDLKIKRRMLKLAEESARSYSENMAQINTNIANITSTIQDGFSLMRELLLRPQFVQPHSSSGQFHGHEDAPSKLLTSPVSCRQEAAAQSSLGDLSASGRSASSELLLKCEEELEPCQKQTSHVYMKEEDEEWSMTHLIVEETVGGKDQTDCKPDLSLLQGNAMSSSPLAAKKETPQ